MQNKHHKIISILIIFIAIIALGFGGYFYYKLKQFQNTPKDLKEKEVTTLIEKVSSHYLFPLDENPTVATVSDPLALKDQSFFTTSEKGDKVLIFSKLGKAILYRPSIDKIIDITSVKK